VRKLFKNLNLVWNKFRKSNDQFWDELEEQLISGDVSVNTTDKLIGCIRQYAYLNNINDTGKIRDLLKKEMVDILDHEGEEKLMISDNPPSVFLVVGVNGVGKTSAIAKLAAMLKNQGKNVIIAAADTYRSAAAEQIQHYAEKLGIELVHHQKMSDPGAVVYDTLEKAIAVGSDIVIIDTAGRMQTSYNLMEELKKIKRVIVKKMGREPEEILMVIDSTTGQNARNQAEIFHRALNLTGVILTKTDGTSRGGIVLTIKNDLKIPVKLVTDGEKLENIYLFDPVKFTDMIFS
jgi:fused signal recognition particle receptor